MPYKFVKAKDESNKFDVSSIVMEVKDTVTIDELVEEFGGFLKACGFHQDLVKEYLNID